MRSVVMISLAVLFLFGFGSCPEKASAAPPVAAAPDALPEQPKPQPGKDGKVDPLEQAKYDAQRYAELAAQAEARYQTMKQQAEDDALRSQIAWITGICLLLAAVAGVAAFLTPVGKKTLVAAAVGFTVIAACAQAFKWAVPYLPWIGGVAIVGGGIWAAINWRRLAATTKLAAEHGDRIEAWLEDLPGDARDAAKKIISDAKDEARKQAELLGVHDQLQYLRGKVPSLWQRIVNKVT